MGPVATGNAFPAFIRSRYSGLGGVYDARADDRSLPVGGEERDATQLEVASRFGLCAGTTVVAGRSAVRSLGLHRNRDV